MTVYDPDTYHPDTFDPDAFPEGATFSLRTVAKLLNDPSSFPVLDDPRTVANAELGREVINELGAIVPYTPGKGLLDAHGRAAGVRPGRWNHHRGRPILRCRRLAMRRLPEKQAPALSKQ